MTPPRWSTRYSDGVRDALIRMVETEQVAEPSPPPSTPRRSHLRLVVAIVIALVLVVPASVTALVLANRAGPAGSAPTVVLPETPTPTATTTPTTARPASAGCAPTTGNGIPAGADTGRIADVDGDHRPDTEWAVLVGGTIRFGITTASGATVSGSAAFAGGGDRTFVVGNLANGVAVVIPSEGRTSDVLTFTDCRLQQTEGRNPALPSVGDAFTLYSEGGGGSAMCVDGVLYALSTESDGGTFANVLTQRVLVSADGARASFSGAKETLATHLDAAALRPYEGVSCGDSPVLRPMQAP